MSFDIGLNKVVIKTSPTLKQRIDDVFIPSEYAVSECLQTCRMTKSQQAGCDDPPIRQNMTFQTRP